MILCMYIITFSIYTRLIEIRNFGVSCFLSKMSNNCVYLPIYLFVE